MRQNFLTVIFRSEYCIYTYFIDSWNIISTETAQDTYIHTPTYILCCLCCHCVWQPRSLFAIVALYLFLFLFSLLTQCTSKGYCHHYLYDLALVLLVWLLTLLVYNFPYGDFIVN